MVHDSAEFRFNSFDRAVAAATALMSAARRARSSSSLNAAAVVPPGVVTRSPQHRRVLAAFLHLPGRPQNGLGGQFHGHVPGETHVDPAVAEGLDDGVDVGRTAAAEPVTASRSFSSTRTTSPTAPKRASATW